MNLSALLVLLVVGFFVLGLIALVIWLLVRDRDNAQVMERIEPDTAQASPVIDVETSAPQPVPEVNLAQAPPASLLSISRDWDNRWNIQVQGRRITSLADVPDATVRKNVMEAIKTLVSLARSYVQGDASDVTKATSGLSPKPFGTEQINNRYSPLQSEGNLSVRINLAKEIGEIVERMLVADPVLRNHSVKVQNVPGGGIQFVLNGQTYKELDDVPNEGVKELIRKATQEWNRS